MSNSVERQLFPNVRLKLNEKVAKDLRYTIAVISLWPLMPTCCSKTRVPCTLARAFYIITLRSCFLGFGVSQLANKVQADPLLGWWSAGIKAYQ